MATWNEFESARPDMAAVLKGILGWIPIAYLATVAADGSPRVHPFVPLFAGRGIFISAIPSPKTRDLLRDGRYAMHALPGKWREVAGSMRGDDEFYMTGRAKLIEDEETRRAVDAVAKFDVRPQDQVLEMEIDKVMTAYWEKVGEPGTSPVRQFWRAG